jgi:hypothetical protein
MVAAGGGRGGRLAAADLTADFVCATKHNFPHRYVNKQVVCSLVMLTYSILSGDINKHKNCRDSAVETTEIDTRWRRQLQQ